MASAQDDERELILRVATQLFAALGYDGTALSQIGESAALDQQAVTAHFGTKRQLYVAVMERAHERLDAVLRQRAEELRAADPERKPAALDRLIDDYVDLCAAHPEMPALWMHRWLSDASDISDLEAQHVRPLAEDVIDSIAPLAEAAGADAHYTVDSMIWCIHGFALSGVLDAAGRRRGPDDPRALRRFRAHLRQMVRRNLGLPA
jgi:AcrR family transcriptional regulator